MTRLDPQALFSTLHADLPAAVHPHVLIAGSLAAAYSFREQLTQRSVNTKDCDVVVHPAGALSEATKITSALLTVGWKHASNCFPGAKDDPEEKLRVIRLTPPSGEDYFVELLGFPEVEQRFVKAMVPFEVNGGWYVLPAFRFMALLSHDKRRAPTGLFYGAPSMMALSNLLSHPHIGSARVGEAIAGRRVLRAAKDLGRVLTLAHLAGRGDTIEWRGRWLEALRVVFPNEWRALARNVGAGLRALVADTDAMADALHTVNVGLLAGKGLDASNLTAIAQRFLVDVAAPVEDAVL